MARLSRHRAECVAESCRKHHDGQHFDEIAERRWVFKGMGAVHVEKSAAVRS